MSPRGQQTRGGVPAWEVGVGLITHRKKWHVMKYYTGLRTWTEKGLLASQEGLFSTELRKNLSI
jgi:hypothetical protein